MSTTYGYPRRRAPRTSSNQIRPATLDDGRIVGEFVCARDGSVILEKHVRAIWQLRKPEGWAIDAHHLEELAALGGGSIRLFVDDGTELTASLDEFDDFGINIDRGFGEQVVLPLDYWNDSTGSHRRPQRTVPVMEGDPPAHQLSMALKANESGPTPRKQSRRHRAPSGPSPVYMAAWRAGIAQEAASQ